MTDWALYGMVIAALVAIPCFCVALVHSTREIRAIRDQDYEAADHHDQQWDKWHVRGAMAAAFVLFCIVVETI